MKITPFETLDIQGLCKEGKNELKKGKNFKYIWSKIGDYRKQYDEFLSEIVSRLKRLNENQVLFLLLNTDKNLIPEKLLKEIILNADRNKSLNNPMGFFDKAVSY